MNDWKINVDTLLFEDLTLTQAQDLQNLTYEGQIYGNVYIEHPAVVAWFHAGSVDQNQKLLMYSTAFLPRAALSASLFFSDAYLN